MREGEQWGQRRLVREGLEDYERGYRRLTREGLEKRGEGAVRGD